VPATEVVELHGHLIDSLTLAKILDQIVGSGSDYEILEIEVGRTRLDLSRARLLVKAQDETVLAELITDLQVFGANPAERADAQLEAADQDGVLPSGFYATTNLPTSVSIGGRWIPVDNPEMDCGLTVVMGGGPDGGHLARTVPMHKVRKGDLIVVGGAGVQVETPPQPRDSGAFTFMNSEVSSEKPKALIISQVADRIRKARAEGGKVLAVCGPAVVHTGAAPCLARLIRGGWVHVVFAGNGFATHDIESNTVGTSLGVSLGEGTTSEHGHANHLRAINEVRRHGSIAKAVEAGMLESGVMYECIRYAIPFVLAGSVRDDGPLPDVYSDVVAAADAMRDAIPGVTVALMLASTLHAVATGNILPSGVATYCVDINPAVVTKLTDRGSHQALGIVTDVGLFLDELADVLESGTGGPAQQPDSGSAE
jgi:lysine-ketoglutarate reductase/saccharopine dehydrogenase-like protein (TIGR00300 family)